MQHHGVDDGEQTSARCYADCEHQNGRYRKTGIPSERAHRVVDVAQRVVNPPNAPCVAARILERFETIRLATYDHTRGLRRESTRLLTLGLLFEVKHEFVREVLLNAVLHEERADAKRHDAQPAFQAAHLTPPASARA